MAEARGRDCGMGCGMGCGRARLREGEAVEALWDMDMVMDQEEGGLRER